tara:strand:- start:41 stop:517 length:477 start_codon:yes stop_codon:yes gene_type:complete
MGLIRLQSSSLPSGSVLQVKYAEIDRTTHSAGITSTTYADLSGYSLAITPTSASSKILITYGLHALEGPSTGGWASVFRTQIMRDTTKIYPTTEADYDSGILGPTNTYTMDKYVSTYLDTPNTTNQITYKIQIKSRDGIGITVNSYANGHFTLMEIAG